jgi:polar amino acid transport system permease protein
MLQQIVSDYARMFSYFNIIFLLQAAGTTLALTFVGSSIGLTLGFSLAAMRQTRSVLWMPLRSLAILFSELFRRIPFIVTLFLVLFSSQAAGFDLPFFVLALISVSIISTAYLAEVFRAGFQSVSTQQTEAAEVLNFPAYKILLLITLPQAWKVVLPAAIAFMVSLVKDTALASQLGVVELSFAGKVLITRGFSSLSVYAIILAGYFAMSYPLALLGNYLEARLSTHKSPQQARATPST